MSHFTVAVFTHTGKIDEVNKLLAPYNENLALEFEEDSDAEIDPITKESGWWYNPKAKWDWYDVGGRWNDMLVVNKTATNSAKVTDLDFKEMKKMMLKDLTPFSKLQEFYSAEYLNARYPTEKDYIETSTQFETYAVITPDGHWYEKASMGWFGVDDGTPESDRKWHKDYHKNFIEPAIKNGWYITIVDCHI